MKKKSIKIISIVFIFILASGLIYGIFFYFSFFQGFISINQNKLSSNLLPDENFTSKYTSKFNFNDMKVEDVPNVTLKIFNENTSKDLKIIEKSQRYYIPIDYIAKILNYSVDNTTSSIVLKNGDAIITLNETSYSSDSYSNTLRGNILNYDNNKYISISDIEEIFGLTALFDFDNKNISLLKSSVKKDSSYETNNNNGNISLIRLEDFTAGDGAGSQDTQHKFKAVADFLYSNSIKYHIAWIPRFKAPSSNIDNDLLTKNSFENAGFINLLDYLINRNAEIGLHGYTHQYGDSRSAVGTELSKKINNNEAATREVVENAIDTATALNIPYSFFESPHYKASESQKSIIEEYFQYIYEPKNYFIYTKLQKTDRNNLYIPTPLSYVKDLDPTSIIDGLKNPRPGELASLFYHATKELDFISINPNSINFDVSYSPESPLKQIVKCIEENNYITVHVTQLKN